MTGSWPPRRRRANLLVGLVFDQLQQLRIFAEEFLADVGAAARFEILIFAVDALFHALQQQAARIAGEQLVPIAAPEHLDDVPAGAAEDAFQFLDDAAVAAHRTIQPLQIAIDDEDEIVELFARRDVQRAGRFGLVHFAVAQKRVDLAISLGQQLAIFQIAQEAGLVDGIDRPETHRNRGKLPEIRHQPRMRIGGKARMCRAAHGGNSADALRSGGLRETRAHRRRARRGPGSRPDRPADRR